MNPFNWHYLIQRIEVDENDVGGGPWGWENDCDEGFYFNIAAEGCVPIGDNDDPFQFRRIHSSVTIDGNGYNLAQENMMSPVPISIGLSNSNQYILTENGDGDYYGSLLKAYQWNATKFFDEFSNSTNNYPGDNIYNPNTLIAVGNISFSDWLDGSGGDNVISNWNFVNGNTTRKGLAKGGIGGANTIWNTNNPQSITELLASAPMDITLMVVSDDSGDGLQEVDDGNEVGAH